MWEEYEDFDHYVRRYGIQRSEGLLLRYLSQLHNVLARSLPEAARDEELWDAIGFFRALLARVDSSLVEEWEDRLAGAADRRGEAARSEPQPYDLVRHPRALLARVRAELHQLVRALATGDLETAVGCVRQHPDDVWDAARFESELAPFLAEHARVVFEPRARAADKTLLRQTAPRCFAVHQVLCDPQGEDLWQLEGEVDLRDERAPAGPLVRMRRIGT
jgi:hypothetical protein